LCLFVHHDIDAATAAMHVPPMVRMYAQPMLHSPDLYESAALPQMVRTSGSSNPAGKTSSDTVNRMTAGRKK